MGDKKETTSKQVPNPTGKGGFQDNPQNRSSGRWRKEDSQSYCLHMFLAMSEVEFLAWGKQNPPEVRTIAQILAYERVMKARTELQDYREVADRTEGKPQQKIEHTGEEGGPIGVIIYKPKKNE